MVQGKKEIWKPIQDWPSYHVSNLGRVKRIVTSSWSKSGMILKGHFNSDGYPCVHLVRERFNTNVSVHRLMLSAFNRPPKKGEQANHLNGIKTDNRLENLEWCSQIENIRHAVRTGLFQRGERNGTKTCPESVRRGENHLRARLKTTDVIAIRLADKTQVELARIYGVSRSAINSIKNRHSWNHV